MSNPTPLFVPFSIRNKIINENCTNHKDIEEIQPNKQYEILLSYMPKEDIFRGIEKRFSKASANFVIRHVDDNIG